MKLSSYHDESYLQFNVERNFKVLHMWKRISSVFMITKIETSFQIIGICDFFG